MEGLLVAVAVLGAATVLGLTRWARDGRMRVRGRAGVSATIRAVDIGVDLGERATLVQFSSAFCAPCRATRRVLAEVTAMVEGVVHVDLDAEAHLDLVRALKVVRTPTVFVVDATGRIVRSASGAPRKADVLAALGHAIP
jgi:thiol-disulfide isomerase/thioredoxin